MYFKKAITARPWIYSDNIAVYFIIEGINVLCKTIQGIPPTHNRERESQARRALMARNSFTKKRIHNSVSFPARSFFCGQCSQGKAEYIKRRINKKRINTRAKCINSTKCAKRVSLLNEEVGFPLLLGTDIILLGDCLELSLRRDVQNADMGHHYFCMWPQV